MKKKKQFKMTRVTERCLISVNLILPWCVFKLSWTWFNGRSWTLNCLKKCFQGVSIQKAVSHETHETPSKTEVKPRAVYSYLASHLHPVKNGSKLFRVPKYDARSPPHRHIDYRGTATSVISFE